MEIPRLTHCCCGSCSLKIGAIIIGYLSLTPSVLLLVASSIALFGMVVDDKNDSAHDAIIFFVFFFLSTLFTAASVLLLVGVYKNKPKNIITWVVVVLVFEAYRIFKFASNLLNQPEPLLLVVLLSIVFDLYLILVVYSYYKEIRNVPEQARSSLSV